MSGSQPVQQDQSKGAKSEHTEQDNVNAELKTSDVYHTKNIPERFDHPGERVREQGEE